MQLKKIITYHGLISTAVQSFLQKCDNNNETINPELFIQKIILIVHGQSFASRVSLYLLCFRRRIVHLAKLRRNSQYIQPLQVMMELWNSGTLICLNFKIL